MCLISYFGTDEHQFPIEYIPADKAEAAVSFRNGLGFGVLDMMNHDNVAAITAVSCKPCDIFVRCNRRKCA